MVKKKTKADSKQPKQHKARTKKTALAVLTDDAQHADQSTAAPFNPTITMTWDGEPAACWTGPLDEIAQANAENGLDDGEEWITEVRASLREHGVYTGGGGAAPVYALKVVESAQDKPNTTTGGRERTSKPDSMTLSELADKYIASLEADGKSDATIGAYRSDLAIAQRVPGAETAIDSILPTDVQRFNESEPVTVSRSGQPKAGPTVERTRRVLRLALDRVEAGGWITVSPCCTPA